MIRAFYTKLSGNPHRPDGHDYLGFNDFESYNIALLSIAFEYQIESIDKGKENIILNCKDYVIELKQLNK